MTVQDLDPREYADFYKTYTAYVPRDASPVEALLHSGERLLDYLRAVPATHGDHAYAPGKWTVKESLQHVIDTERIFSVRLLRILRGDATPQPGFDQNEYASAADVSGREFVAMVREFELLRGATVLLVETLAPADAQKSGTVSGGPMTARALAFITAGHVYHHDRLYRERYGLG